MGVGLGLHRGGSTGADVQKTSNNFTRQTIFQLEGLAHAKKQA